MLRLSTPVGNVWAQAGGTSAAAPLMAAITANIDSASAAAGGQSLGFANPFVYAHPGVFRDITLGTNSVHGIGPPYPADPGYDIATGLGSPDGAALAAALIAATTQAAADATQLSAVSSAAAYAGDNGFHTSQSASHVLMVQPTLTTAANATWNGSQYSTKHGTAVTLSGVSTPAMSGAVLTVQTRLKGTTKWVASGTTVTVAANGSYATPFTFPSAVKEYVRFAYTGSQTGPWLSAKSPARLFAVS